MLPYCQITTRSPECLLPLSLSLRVFGFVAKKTGSLAENICHLFAELDPEQPASAIVNFINKVMLSQRR